MPLPPQLWSGTQSWPGPQNVGKRRGLSSSLRREKRYGDTTSSIVPPKLTRALELG